MSDYYLQQRDNIIRAAFRVWSESHFSNMSLSLVSDDLSITKTALYRYFKNKDELLETMITRFSDSLYRAIGEFEQSSAAETLSEAVRKYYSFLFGYFFKNPYYYSFVIFFILHKMDSFSKNLFRERDKINDYFYRAMDKDLFPENKSLRDVIARFIQLNGFFWSMQLFSVKAEPAIPAYLDFNKKMDEAATKQLLEKAVSFACEGYCSSSPDNSLSYQEIMDMCWVTPDQMLEPDRIFSAIEEVVGEVGYADASLERIAERIGINKSSLYFYFKNKNEMFFKTIQREQEHLIGLTIQQLEHVNSFEEKLFGFFVALASQMINKPYLMTTIHWLRKQNIGVNFKKKDMDNLFVRFGFLREGIERGRIRAPETDPGTVLVFIFFFLMNEMKYLPKNKPDVKNALEKLFALYCGGINSVRKISQNINEE